ncbi:unnamed protein product [Arctogadus glacialis]
MENLRRSSEPQKDGDDKGPLGTLPIAASEVPSDLYQSFLRQSEYPPIIQNQSCRTLGVPYKEQCHHRTPSESIANNYSPCACDLRVQRLPQRRHRSRHDPPNPPTSLEGRRNKSTFRGR